MSVFYGQRVKLWTPLRVFTKHKILYEDNTICTLQFGKDHVKHFFFTF